MSETVRVPLEGQHVTPQAQAPQPTQQPARETGFQNGVYQPPTQRPSLHQTSAGIRQAYKESMERQTQASAPAPAPAPQPSQTDALSQQITQLTNTVALLAANQLSNTQRGYDAPDRRAEQLENLLLHHRYGDGPYTGDSQQYSIAPDQPDPALFDPYDETSMAEFHHLNRGYVSREVQRGVEADRAARAKADEDQALNAEWDTLQGRYGRDRNFAEVADLALRECANAMAAKKPFSITETYKRVSGEVEARRGRRERSSYLPADCKTLAQIWRYNIETGRSRG